MDQPSSSNRRPTASAFTKKGRTPDDRLIRGNASGLWAWTLLFAYIGCSWVSIFLYRAPAVKALDAPGSEFSAMRAFSHVKRIAAEPHPTGSPANVEVRTYLMAELQKLGLEVNEQRTEGAFRGKVGSVPLTNVVARKRGSAQSPALMLCVHYDSAPRAPGAGDDAAAVAALLEVLRALDVGPLQRNDLIVLFTDGEELGLLGAQAFVIEHSWTKEVGLVCNFDARGTRGPSIMFETSEGNLPLIREFSQGVSPIIATSLSGIVYRYMPNGTDFTVFKRAGLSGLNFAFIEGSDNYHRPTDTPSNLDLKTLQHTGELMLGLGRHFGNIPLPLARAGDAVYFNALGSLFVHYPISWVAPSALLLGVIAVLILYFGRRNNHWRVSRILIGLGWVFTATCCSGLAGWVVLKLWIQLTKKLPGVAALWITAIAVVLLVGLSFKFLARRKSSSVEAGVAALVGWTIVAVITSVFVPEGSYLFFWPALLGWAVLGPCAWRSQRNAAALYSRAWYATNLAGLGGVVLLSPIGFLLWIALPPTLPVLAFLFALLLALLVTILDAVWPFPPRAEFP